MMVLQNFLVSFAFSFVGSIPPGTINLIALQIGLEKKTSIAWKFCLAAALVEYPYAWIAVTFTSFILESPIIVDNLRLITGIVMVSLGVLNLASSNKPSAFTLRLKESGFRRGLVLGILNPMAIPYWVAMTAYLRSHQWIELSTPVSLHLYLLGVSLGGFALLMILVYLANKVASSFQQSTWIKKIPGIVLVVLGLYAFFQLLQG